MDYVLECFKLVYWAFFKKNTLIEWLQTIDPRLKFDTSPFRYRKDFRQNPKLKRYAIQTLVLSTIAPAILDRGQEYFREFWNLSLNLRSHLKIYATMPDNTPREI